MGAQQRLPWGQSGKEVAGALDIEFEGLRLLLQKDRYKKRSDSLQVAFAELNELDSEYPNIQQSPHLIHEAGIAIVDSKPAGGKYSKSIKERLAQIDELLKSHKKAIAELEQAAQMVMIDFRQDEGE